MGRGHRSRSLQPIGVLSQTDQAAAIQMEKDYLILKRGSASRPSGERNDDDYDVLANDVVVGRILKLNAAPAMSWMWALEPFEHHEAMLRHAKRRWRHSLRVGGGNSAPILMQAGSPTRQNFLAMGRVSDTQLPVLVRR